jgi:hypothetical protein
MGKAVLQVQALEALALSELIKRPRCGDARRVVVRPCIEPHPITRAYWAPANVNPGTSGIEICQREVWRVCEELARDYELAP